MGHRVRQLEQFGNLQAIADAQIEMPKETRYVQDMDITLRYNNLLVSKAEQAQHHVWGAGDLLASGDGRENAFYFKDHLGSPTRLVGEGQSTPLAYNCFTNNGNQRSNGAHPALPGLQ